MNKWKLVPVEPTPEMDNAARDWSVSKYGRGIGNDAAHGCYSAMLEAAPPAPSVPDGWKLVPYTPTEEMLEQAAYAVNSRPKPSKYEATATPAIIFWNAMLKYSPESTGIKEPPADLVRDAKPDIWRVMCGDWRDKTVAIHNSAGYITCGLDPAKAAVLVRAHNGEMSDGGAAIAEVKGQS